MTGGNPATCECGPELERQARQVQELELERDAYIALHRELFPDRPDADHATRLAALRALAIAFNTRGEHLSALRTLLRHELGR